MKSVPVVDVSGRSSKRSFQGIERKDELEVEEGIWLWKIDDDL